jgi:hypothetical protein
MYYYLTLFLFSELIPWFFNDTVKGDEDQDQRGILSRMTMTDSFISQKESGMVHRVILVG